MKAKTKTQLAKEWYEELDYLFKKSMAEIQEAKETKKSKKKDISQNNNSDEQYVPFKKFKGL